MDDAFIITATLVRRMRTRYRVLSSTGVPYESQEQKWYFAECLLRAEADPRWGMVFSIPNGGGRSKGQQSILNSLGQRRGIPDMMLAVPVGQWSGLFIELKRVKGGTVSSEQVEWISKLRGQGYCAVVCCGSEMALALTEAYLAGAITAVGEAVDAVVPPILSGKGVRVEKKYPAIRTGN